MAGLAIAYFAVGRKPESDAQVAAAPAMDPA
jgi:hypothetical protein